jgi:hypothetical protein
MFFLGLGAEGRVPWECRQILVHPVAFDLTPTWQLASCFGHDYVVSFRTHDVALSTAEHPLA